MKTQFKLLLMALITVIASFVGSSGIPSTPLAWSIAGITIGGTMLVYIAKNLIAPSTSVPGILNIGDIISGLVLAVGTALSDFAASAITSTAIVWGDVIKMVGVVVIGYLAKTLFTGGLSLKTS